MSQIVSITTQGQLTIPKTMLRELGVVGKVKAVVERDGDFLVVRPQAGFWSLQGSLPSKNQMSELDLRKAREAFSKQWSGQ